MQSKEKHVSRKRNRTSGQTKSREYGTRIQECLDTHKSNSRSHPSGWVSISQKCNFSTMPFQSRDSRGPLLFTSISKENIYTFSTSREATFSMSFQCFYHALFCCLGFGKLVSSLIICEEDVLSSSFLSEKTHILVPTKACWVTQNVWKRKEDTNVSLKGNCEGKQRKSMEDRITSRNTFKS